MTLVHTLTEALALPAPAEQPVLVIGGYAMYAEALAQAGLAPDAGEGAAKIAATFADGPWAVGASTLR